MLTRFAPRKLLVSLARWKQSILFLFSTLIYLSMTLPIIMFVDQGVPTYTLLVRTEGGSNPDRHVLRAPLITVLE